MGAPASAPKPEAFPKKPGSSSCRVRFTGKAGYAESFARAMTQNLSLREGQKNLFDFYMENYFSRRATEFDETFDSVLRTQARYPELFKPSLREQNLTIRQKIHDPSQSLKDFVKSFSQTSAKIRANLFQIHANFGYWRKLLGWSRQGTGSLNKEEKKEKPREDNQNFLEYLETFFDEKTLKLLSSPDIDHRQKTMTLYKILDQLREEKLRAGEDDRKISQAMLDLVHTVGFGNSGHILLLKSEKVEEQLKGIYGILAERDQMAFLLGFGGFAELQQSLGGGRPSMLSKKEDVFTTLTEIEKDIEQSDFQIEESHTLRVRALSFQESPFRSCLGGGDCASQRYFDKAFDPNFIYFTLTDPEHRSSGQITTVLGEAKEGAGPLVKVAFVDKIQNVPHDLIVPMLEGIRLSLGELGYKLGLPVDVGDHDGLSNLSGERLYIEREVNPQLTNKLIGFKPHEHGYSFPTGYSRAYDLPDLLEFEWQGERHFEIHPGGLYSSRIASESLSVRGLYEEVLSWRDSEKEEEQIKFINQLVQIQGTPELDISFNEAVGYLRSKIKNKALSFPLRKAGLFAMIELAEEKWSEGSVLNSYYESFLKALDHFSPKEERLIWGEISNWSRGWNKRRRAFVNGLLFRGSVEQRQAILHSSRWVLILDIEARYGELNNTALIEAVFDDGKKMLEDLLKKGANKEAQNEDGHTALAMAVLIEDIEKIRLLLKVRANPYAKNLEGDSILDLAKGTKNKRVIALIESYCAHLKKTWSKTE